MLIREFDVRPARCAGKTRPGAFTGGEPGHRWTCRSHCCRGRPPRALAMRPRPPIWGSTQQTLQARLDSPFAGDREGPRNIAAILVEPRQDLARRSAGEGGHRLRLARSPARALGVPLNVLFGGSVRDTVPILRILAIKTPPRWRWRRRSWSTKAIAISRSGAREIEKTWRVSPPLRKQVGDDVHLTSMPTSPIPPKAPSRRSTDGRAPH